MKVLILIIIALEFVYSRTLSLLNIRASRRPVPEELQGIYDAEQYGRQQAYMRANVRWGFVDATIGLLLTLWLFAGGGYALLDGWSRALVALLPCTGIGAELLVTLFFFGMLFVLTTLIGLPMAAYITFGIETRFGFNKSTWGLFLRDQLVNFLMTVVLSGLIISVLFLLYVRLTDYFWLLAFVVMLGFQLTMTYFYSDLIVPLFNKQTPLPEGELRTAIEQFLKQVGVEISNIYLIDGSKRSSKANAYFAGFGSRRRIVLYDTLMEQLSTDEIVAVLGHEVGHMKHRHVLLSQLLSSVQSLLIFGLLGLVLGSDAVAQAAGLPEASFHVNLLVFSLLYTPLDMVLSMALNCVSRRFEYQADAFIAEAGYGEALIRALKRISSQALSNLTPHPLRVFMEYSHPTLLQRIRAVRNVSKGRA